MTGLDVDRVVAGAPVMYPAVMIGDRSMHLARAEARRKSEPLLLGICTKMLDVPMQRAPRPRWWRRRRPWCGQCKAYRDHLRSRGQL